MAGFPTTRGQVKLWIASTLDQVECSALQAISHTIDQFNIDGKMLLLLYKYPQELIALMPEPRSRLLFVNALDVLVKSAGKDLPVSLLGSDLPSESLMCRMASLNFTSQHQARLAPTSHQNTNFPGALADGSQRDNAHLLSPGEQQQIMGSGSRNARNGEHIPSPVPLPVFDQTIQQAIQNGRLGDRHVRARLANACARFYVNLKMYPTQIDYHKICERLVGRYPGLCDAAPKNPSQPWSQLKKQLSMAFCSVRRVMKTKDMTNARHMIGRIQKRYRGFGRNNSWCAVPGDNRSSQNRLSDDLGDSDSNGDSFSESASNQRVLPNPPPIPPLNSDLNRALTLGLLRERPWSSQFYRRCARFYTRLKPFPTRKDYRNISCHLAKTFGGLGHQGHVKRMLSQYIRCHRQSRKLRKLDRHQRLSMEFSKAANNGTARGTLPVSEFHFVDYGGHAVGNLLRDDSSLRRTQYGSTSQSLGVSSLSESSRPSSSSLPDGSNISASSLSFPVPLPPLDESMWTGIREGQLRERNLRNRFIRLCANFYVDLKRYPTKEDYNNICRTVIEQFPELRDPVPLPKCPPFMLFKKAMTACIRNKRRDPGSPRGASSSDWPTAPSSTDLPSNPVVPGRTDAWGCFVQPSAMVGSSREFANSQFPGESGPAMVAGQHLSSINAVGHQQLPALGVGDHLPLPLPLPVFSPELTTLLSSGQPIVGDARTAFFRTCTEFYTMMKPFPSRTDVGAICSNLVQAFPQLADAGSSAGRMGFTDLSKQMSVRYEAQARKDFPPTNHREEVSST